MKHDEALTDKLTEPAKNRSSWFCRYSYSNQGKNAGPDGIYSRSRACMKFSIGKETAGQIKTVKPPQATGGRRAAGGPAGGPADRSVATPCCGKRRFGLAVIYCVRRQCDMQLSYH